MAVGRYGATLRRRRYFSVNPRSFIRGGSLAIGRSSGSPGPGRAAWAARRWRWAGTALRCAAGDTSRSTPEVLSGAGVWRSEEALAVRGPVGLLGPRGDGGGQVRRYAAPQEILLGQPPKFYPGRESGDRKKLWQSGAR